MLNRSWCRCLALSLAFGASVARAEPVTDVPAAGGRSPAPRAPRPSPGSSAPARHVFPADAEGMLERLRDRGRLPAKGFRSQGRAARARERAFEAALRNPEVGEDKVREKMQEMRDNADEMRRERRRAAFARWGEATLGAEGKAELDRHGRTLARIRRMQFLAATEREGEARTALLERLAQTRDLERGRHERAMAALSGQTPRQPFPSAAATGSSKPRPPKPLTPKLAPAKPEGAQ